MAKRNQVIDAVMNEHILLPGCPQIVVTRGWAYQWLVAAGMDTHARGFASLDYMVFGRKEVSEPLSDVDGYYATFLAGVQKSIQAGA